MIWRSDPTIVLLYHRVSDAERDPHSLFVRPDRFADHVAALARNFDVVPLAEVPLHRSGRRVAITFDDGYADNAEVAAPILRHEGLPATLFVSTGGLDDDREFWWDRLEHLVLEGEAAEFLELDIAGRPVRIDIRTSAGRARAIRALNRRLRVLPPMKIEETLAAVEAQTGLRATPCKAHARLGGTALRSLTAEGTFEIGGHTHSHPRLAALDRDEQRYEIEENRRILEQALGRPVHSFAYPFGTPGTFDDTTVKMVRATGYELACANLPGRVSRWTDRYRIPRHLVGNWTGGELAHRLRLWFDG